MNLKNYTHLTQIFLIGQNYFNNDQAQLYLIFQYFLVLKTQSPNGNLKDFQMKNLNLLIEQIKVFLQNCYGINLD